MGESDLVSASAEYLRVREIELTEVLRQIWMGKLLFPLGHCQSRLFDNKNTTGPVFAVAKLTQLCASSKQTDQRAGKQLLR